MPVFRYLNLVTQRFLFTESKVIKKILNEVLGIL
jgi:hypothetical protein